MKVRTPVVLGAAIRIVKRAISARIACVSTTRDTPHVN